ncbi:MAG: LCP family protein [Eubacteriales bacterium]|nr:LCP family protein [Eubacteriales bacterium]
MNIKPVWRKTKKGFSKFLSQLSIKQWILLLIVAAITTSVVVFVFASGKNPVDTPVINPNETTVPTEPDVTKEPTQPSATENDVEPTTKITYENYRDDPKGLLSKGEYGKKIVEDGSVNILIMGEDRNALVDTIGIISINKKSNTIKIIMIPRDMYVDYNDGIIDYLKINNLYSEPGAFKINYTYFLGVKLKHEGKFSDRSKGISLLTEVMEEKFDLEINDYIKVDTKGFVEIVDLFDGVDIEVPYHMNYSDPSQDLYIYIEEGPQHLDGKDAEGFVRYRKGYDLEGDWHEYGDIARKRNQISFLKAFFNQHFTLGNITKLPEFLQILGSNVKTSINAKEIINKYIGIATDIVVQKYSMSDMTLTGKDKDFKGAAYLIIE